MPSRIFDPNAGTGSTLVYSVSNATEARNAAIRYERERVDLERERELRSIARVMTQRTGVCG